MQLVILIIQELALKVDSLLDIQLESKIKASFKNEAFLYAFFIDKKYRELFDLKNKKYNYCR